MAIELPGVGLELRADVSGPPGGVPVLLLHGGGQTRGAWGGTALALGEAGFRAYAIDSRGHGESDWAVDGDYSIDTQASDLRAIVNFLGKKVVLAGASLGGLAALIAAGEAPGLDIAGLVLVDVSPHLAQSGVDAIVGFMRETLGGFEAPEDAANAIATYLPHRKRPADLSGITKNLRLRSDGRFHWHWDPKTLLHILDPQIMNPRLENAAKHILCPTILMRGAESELVSQEVAEDFMRLFEDGHVVEIQHARHMVAGDSNSVFRDALIKYLVNLDLRDDRRLTREILP